jgi:hypothetical protein
VNVRIANPDTQNATHLILFIARHLDKSGTAGDALPGSRMERPRA